MTPEVPRRHALRGALPLRLSAICAGILAVSCGETVSPSVPTAPSNLRASAASSSQIDLSWTDNSTNETGFAVDHATSSGGPWTEIGRPSANATSYSATGLNSAATYYFRVRATNGVGDSSNSNVASAATLDVPPTSPSNLTATAMSSSRIDLSWTDVSNNETRFEVEQATSGGGPWTEIGRPSANATSYSATGLSAAMTYYFRVRATNGVGDSSDSNVASATTLDVPPAAPSNLTAMAMSSNQIDLGWTDNSTNETGFEVGQATSGAGPWTQIGAPGADATSYSATGLSPAATYYFRVRATNGVGDSSDSNVASATTPDVLPTAPSNLSALAGSSSQVDLGWTDNSTNETGFAVDRATSSGGPWTQIGTPGANATGYSATGLSSATTYYFRVRATNGVGDSSDSNVASATTLDVLPTAPSNLMATALSSSQVDLSWTDNSTNETGFAVEQATSGAGPWTQIGTSGANATSYSATGLSSTTTYYFRVRATNGVGGSSDSNVASAITLDVPPTAPSSLSALAGSSSQVDLRWTDNSANETGFEVDQATSSGGPWMQIGTASANATSYSATGLSVGTTYYFRVRATNSGGDSPNSNVAAATPPFAPSNLTATAASSSQINLSWMDNSTDELGFEVAWATSSAGPWPPLGTRSADQTSYAATGLSAGTTYYFQVRGYNLGGVSSYSNIASATTLDVLPAAPSNLSALAGSSSQVELFWTDNSTNETGFEIDRATASGGPWTQIGTASANATMYSATGLSAGTTFYFRVRATNSGGDSSNSNVAAATPPFAPSNLTATAASSSQINLSWTDNSTGTLGFAVERATSSAGPWTEIWLLGAGQASYAATGLSAGTTYYFQVRGYNFQEGLSSYSNVASAATLGAPPPNASPVVTIVVPSQDTTIAAGSAVTLSATATDAEDGDLSSSVTWTSSLDGSLGTGTTLMPTLAPGVHTVVASVQDAGALSASDTVTVMVPSFFLATNGITVRCPGAAVGDSGAVGGTVYTKRSRADLYALVASSDFASLETSCTSGVTDMVGLFRDRPTFNHDIRSWDVSSVTVMESMFVNAVSFNQDISAWDVSSVTNTRVMFRGASAFDQDIGSWNVSNVTLMDLMFAETSFNQPIGSWNVANVQNMYAMFFNNPAFNQDIGAWDVSSVTSLNSMFSGASTFNQDIGSWDVSGVTDMYAMFALAGAFNGDISAWDVGNVANMDYLFVQAASFNRDLSGWCVGLISSQPFDFDLYASAWVLPNSRPVWGTCPSNQLPTVQITPQEQDTRRGPGGTPVAAPDHRTALAS